MWRTSGEGESYLYIPKNVQVSTLCSNPLVICNSAYGYSVGRGKFNWDTGVWNSVTQILHLNTVGQQDGSITEEHDGTTAYNLGQLIFRQSNYGVAGIGKTLRFYTQPMLFNPNSPSRCRFRDFLWWLHKCLGNANHAIYLLQRIFSYISVGKWSKYLFDHNFNVYVYPHQTLYGL